MEYWNSALHYVTPSPPYLLTRYPGRAWRFDLGLKTLIMLLMQYAILQWSGVMIKEKRAQRCAAVRKQGWP